MLRSSELDVFWTACCIDVFPCWIFPSSLREGGGAMPEIATWCERRDSNPHAFRRWNLNPVRLPIPPLSRSRNYTRNRGSAELTRDSGPQRRYNRGNSKASAPPLPVDHYENFPVASWLLPPALRAPIEAIYGFARGADDIADEGDLPDSERLAGLDRYLQALDAIERGRAPGRAVRRASRMRFASTSCRSQLPARPASTRSRRTS